MIITSIYQKLQGKTNQNTKSTQKTVFTKSPWILVIQAVTFCYPLVGGSLPYHPKKVTKKSPGVHPNPINVKKNMHGSTKNNTVFKEKSSINQPIHTHSCFFWQMLLFFPIYLRLCGLDSVAKSIGWTWLGVT